jgi:hypothetical protein
VKHYFSTDEGGDCSKSVPRREGVARDPEAAALRALSGLRTAYSGTDQLTAAGVDAAIKT